MWNKIIKEKQMTVVLYIDDLKVSFCEEDGSGELDEFLRGLSKVYGKLEPNRDDVFDYCGINVDYGTKGVCKLSTTKYIEAAVTEFEAVHGKIKRGAKTPAQSKLFDDREGATLLEEKKRKVFHSVSLQDSYGWASKRVQIPWSP